MSPKLQNCWEYMKCGREPGGDSARELGVCPAVTDTSFDGINRGKNAGRFCWAVAGTLCGGRAQGTFAEKRESCLGCDFFNKVCAEEGTANLRTKFLRFVFTDTGRPLFNNLAYKHVKSGERFISQGDVEDMAYIIQRGSCIVLVEKDGKLYPVGHRGEGDIVGMTTILTGEPRIAHVEAETDMELWVLRQEQFADASRDDPDLLSFFSELVADRFDSKRPMADRTIGKYVASDIIGRGGFSLVYKGVHLGLNIPVAIKMLRHDMAMDPDFLGTFQNEAQTIAALHHENIIHVYDIEQRFKTVFIIMEYLEGQSLKDMLTRLKKIPTALAVDFLLQICAGLNYAHQRGIIHRDINPSNIIIERNDRLKILDFGLACPIGTEDFCSLGTMAYMAPEQIEAEAMDQRTDIYALGILAYEMVTGKLPFDHDDPQQLMRMHLEQDIPDPSDLIGDLPPALCRIIHKAGRRDPDRRYQDVMHMAEELKGLMRPTDLRLQQHLPENHNNAAIVMRNDGQRQEEISRLMEEFGERARQLGVEFKITDGADR